MSVRVQARDRFLQRFEERAAALGRGEAPFVARLRREARDVFAEQGLPHAKMEEWRYTNLDALAGIDFADPPAEPGTSAGVDRATVEALSFPVFACSLYVFVNGRFAPDLSSPRALSGGLRAESLAELRRGDAEGLEPLGAGWT